MTYAMFGDTSSFSTITTETVKQGLYVLCGVQTARKTGGALLSKGLLDSHSHQLTGY